jgi:anaerobic magnesium-protoporphyrin IX monomethyl ester cyclase
VLGRSSRRCRPRSRRYRHESGAHHPRWTFEGSIYFGCRDPHLPLEHGYTKALLEARGHQVLLVDAPLMDLSLDEVRAELRAFGPEMTVVTTAPTYLFWRCAPPELRVPKQTVAAIRDVAGVLVAVGPHGSATPATVLEKLGVDVVVMGECEETVARLAEGEREVPGVCLRVGGDVQITGGPQATPFVDTPALFWPDELIRRHRAHHHRFDRPPRGPGAEVEASRGCPYHCSFCAKELFRNQYRRRSLDRLLAEIDALIGQGVEYVYFIDEIFLPNRPLLEALVGRDLVFGVQTRIDLWKPAMIELLGRAGCVSIEAGVESFTPEGRDALDKDCRLGTEELTERLILAKRCVPFVQANLIETPLDEPATVGAWREEMRGYGIWANDPVPLFPYPGSPDYRKLWGAPDDQAWERAHEYYLAQFADFSEIQDEWPLPIVELEARAA